MKKGKKRETCESFGNHFGLEGFVEWGFEELDEQSRTKRDPQIIRVRDYNREIIGDGTGKKYQGPYARGI